MRTVTGRDGDGRRKAKYCYIMCGATNEEAADKQQGENERQRERERLCD